MGGIIGKPRRNAMLLAIEQIRWQKSSGYPLPSIREHGKPQHWIGFFEDISSSKNLPPFRFLPAKTLETGLKAVAMSNPIRQRMRYGVLVDAQGGENSGAVE